MTRAKGEKQLRPKPQQRNGRTRDRRKRPIDEQLDDALKQTFPASDPIAVTPPRKKPD